MTATIVPNSGPAEQLPLVSAVIPTRNRPDLVCRAVHSALAQTYSNIEVVVVVDGPDSSTVAALEGIQDARIRIIAIAESVGGSEARNIGVRESRGEYVGLLDDDDEWFPEKIREQMNLGVSCSDSNVLIACKYINRDGISDAILPSALPQQDEDISEFLFCHCSLFGTRLGFIQTSTWLIPRRLLIDVPFTPGLKVNQDTDWLLRASRSRKVKVLFVNEPLAVFYNEPARARIGSAAAKGKIAWTYTFDWAMASRELFTAKALAFFLITVPCAHALSQGMFRQSLLRATRARVLAGQVTVSLALIIAKYTLASLLPATGPHRLLARRAYALSMRRYSAR